MKTLKYILPTFLLFSTLISFLIWRALVMDNFIIENTTQLLRTLRWAFHPRLYNLTMLSLAGGFGMGLVGLFFYFKKPKGKSKGVIRGTEIVPVAKLKRLLPRRKGKCVTLAEVPIPHDLESLHFLICGSTGAGKSVAITEMLYGMITRRDKVIVMDPNGEFLSRFFCTGDKVLNPFDIRGEGWSIYNEIRSPYDYEHFAKSIVPPALSNHDAAWHGYAQLLFSATARALNRVNENNNSELQEWLTIKHTSELKDLLKDSPAIGLFEPGAEKALASTRYILTQYMAPHQHLKPGKFSLRKWIESKERSNLFITWRENMIGALRPLISCWMDILCTSVLSLEPNPHQMIWLVVDELASLERINSLEPALTKGRKHGLRVVAGLQSISQLDRLYGKDQSSVLRSCFRNLLVLGSATSDFQTAQNLSLGLGEQIIERGQKSVTRNSQGINRTETMQQVREQTVMAGEIMKLQRLEGYLGLPEHYPITKVKLKVLDFPLRVKPFEEED